MRTILPVLLFFLSGCEYVKEKVDLVIVNANIYTVDDNFSKAESFAVHKGRFVAVGTAEEIRETYTSDQLVDADGRTITPGLIDAHCHFYGLGLNQQVVDLTGTKSFGEVLERVEEIEDLARRLAISEYQMNTHTIGDSANAVVLCAYDSVLRDGPGRRWKSSTPRSSIPWILNISGRTSSLRYSPPMPPATCTGRKTAWASSG
jgi:predicted amidohydrolase YtcJ